MVPHYNGFLDSNILYLMWNIGVDRSLLEHLVLYPFGGELVDFAPEIGLKDRVWRLA